jgi:hypothetical protein
MISLDLFGQSYKVEISYEPYDSLTQYISLSNNGTGLYFEQTEFELPWEFPFFEKKVNTLLTDETSLIYLTDDKNSSEPYLFMYLLNNVWIRYFQDQNSDYRFGQSSPDNVCFEWRKVGSWTTISDKPGDRGYATFKTCFWKNGEIELHFDQLKFDSTLFDSIFTVPGIPGVVTSIALTNPDKRDEGIILSNDPNNPKIINKWDYSDKVNPPYLKVLPKDNLKIKFIYNKSTSINNLNHDLFKIESPVSSVINMPEDLSFSEFKIFSNTGEIVHSGNKTQEILIENLSPGLYFLLLINGGNVKYKYKFIKI